jgi:hypothetical protein
VVHSFLFTAVLNSKLQVSGDLQRTGDITCDPLTVSEPISAFRNTIQQFRGLTGLGSVLHGLREVTSSLLKSDLELKVQFPV